MKFDKYLVHDVYHVTQNLEIIEGFAQKDDIIRFVQQSGKKNEHWYDESEIKACINHLETIRIFKQVEKDKYVVIA